MRIYFVRHGESEANIAHIFSNRDLPHWLTEKGIAQAQALAEVLCGQSITAIYSSPIPRAQQTTEIIVNACRLPFTLTPALREWDTGIYEGRDDAAGWASHEQVQQDWFWHNKLDSRMPEGESFNDMRARFLPFVDAVLATHYNADEAVVLLAHGGLYHAMLPLVLPNIDRAFVAAHPLTHTAIVRAELGEQGLRCFDWNGVAL